jgi:hypothetical protein
MVELLPEIRENDGTKREEWAGFGATSEPVTHKA